MALSRQQVGPLTSISCVHFNQVMHINMGESPKETRAAFIVMIHLLSAQLNIQLCTGMLVPNHLLINVHLIDTMA